MDPIVRIESLQVLFKGTPILKGVDLDCRVGEITVLMGPSGSGKTTLLRAVNRLNEVFSGMHTEGAVWLSVDGRPADAYAPTTDVAALRRRAAMVFQTPNVLPTSIRKNFTLPLRHATGLSRPEIERRMMSALGDVELLDEVEHRLGEPALNLSGGQQQRLCLARALALEPDVLLLDEPTASLDFRATRQIERLLDRLKNRYLILAVSHSIGQTSRIADRSYILKDGLIVEELERSTLHEPARLQQLAEELF